MKGGEPGGGAKVNQVKGKRASGWEGGGEGKGRGGRKRGGGGGPSLCEGFAGIIL